MLKNHNLTSFLLDIEYTYKKHNWKNMTFIDFKKLLLDAELTIPKFTNLIKVSEKNIQAYKKKKEVPNAIAAIAACFAQMNKEGKDFRTLITDLELKQKEKKGSGFSAKKKEKDKDKQEKKTEKKEL